MVSRTKLGKKRDSCTSKAVTADEKALPRAQFGDGLTSSIAPPAD
jgi:hypothetical protein